MVLKEVEALQCEGPVPLVGTELGEGIRQSERHLRPDCLMPNETYGVGASATVTWFETALLHTCLCLSFLRSTLRVASAK